MARPGIQRLQKGKKSKKNNKSKLAISKKLSTEKSCDYEAVRDEKYLVFFEWLKENGAVSPKLELRQVSKDNRIMIATKDIHERETILHVPKKLLITIEVAKQSDLVKQLSEKSGDDEIYRNDLLTLFILEEKNNPNSFWKPYLDILPSGQSFNSVPINYTPEQRKQLEGTYLNELLKQTEFQRDLSYHMIKKMVPGVGRYTKEEYFAVRTMLLTRVFSCEMQASRKKKLLKVKTQAKARKMVIAPLADMLNHQEPAKTTWHYSQKARGFHMVGVSPLITKGSEVTTSYGSRNGPTQMLMGYGFIPAEIDDSVTIDVRRLIAKVYKKEPKFQEIIAFQKEKNDKLWREKAKPLDVSHKYSKNSKELFSLLRFCLLEKEDEVKKSDPKKMTATSIDNEYAMLEVLEELCCAKLAGYPTWFKDDMKRLNQGGLSFNESNITRLLVGEKRILHFYIAWSQACRGFLSMSEEQLINIVEQNRQLADLFVGYINEIILPLVRKKSAGA